MTDSLKLFSWRANTQSGRDNIRDAHVPATNSVGVYIQIEVPTAQSAADGQFVGKMEGYLTHPCLGSLSPAFRSKLQRYINVLRYAAKASNVNMLVSKLEARTVMEDVLGDLVATEPSWRSFVLESGLLTLIAAAAARAMDLVAKDCGAVAVLKGSSVSRTFEGLCRDTSWLLSRLVIKPEERALHSQEVQDSWMSEQQQQITSSGADSVSLGSLILVHKLLLLSIS